MIVIEYLQIEIMSRSLAQAGELGPILATWWPTLAFGAVCIGALMNAWKTRLEIAKLQRELRAADVQSSFCGNAVERCAPPG